MNTKLLLFILIFIFMFTIGAIISIEEDNEVIDFTTQTTEITETTTEFIGPVETNTIFGNIKKE